MVSSTIPPSCVSLVRYRARTGPSCHVDLSLSRVLAQAKRHCLDSLTRVPACRDKARSRSPTNFLGMAPPLGVDKVADLLRIVAGQYTRRQHFQFLRQLKLTLYQAIQEHALQYLESRVSLQLLPGGVSWKWLTSLATVPKLAVNGVARFAVLRWAVNEDDDECLRLRLAGSLQAEQPCQLCGIRTRLYPLGLNFAPACEKCCHDHNINATTLHSVARWGIPDTSHWQSIADAVRGSFVVPETWTNRNRHLPPCVACGYGDNSSQHWARFCIIPVLVANTLSPPIHTVRSLDQLARTNAAGCVIASHVLHQFSPPLVGTWRDATLNIISYP